MVLTWHDALLVQLVHEGGAVLAALVESLLEQDGSRDVISQTWCGQEQLPVCTPVGLGVVDPNAVQPLSAGGVGLVHGQNTAALGGNRVLQTCRSEHLALHFL